MIGKKIPKWESELWSYVSTSDGEHCPLQGSCQVRQKGGWCPDDNKKRLNRLLDRRQFNLGGYDFVKSEGERPCRLGQLVEVIAQKYLKMGEIRCLPVPTVLIALVDQQGSTEVRELPLKAYHGAIWHPKGGWIIQLKADDTSAVKRFAVFHEAFHILAHCKTSPVFRKRGAIQGSFNELLADYFAACMLMLREWVREKWAEVT